MPEENPRQPRLRYEIDLIEPEVLDPSSRDFDPGAGYRWPYFEERLFEEGLINLEDDLDLIETLRSIEEGGYVDPDTDETIEIENIRMVWMYGAGVSYAFPGWGAVDASAMEDEGELDIADAVPEERALGGDIIAASFSTSSGPALFNRWAGDPLEGLSIFHGHLAMAARAAVASPFLYVMKRIRIVLQYGPKRREPLAVSKRFRRRGRYYVSVFNSVSGKTLKSIRWRPHLGEMLQMIVYRYNAAQIGLKTALRDIEEWR